MDDQEQETLRREAPGGLTEEAEEAARERLSEGLNPEGPTASMDDMRVSRKNGDLEPLKVKTLWNGHVILFRPINYRDRNKYRLDRRGLIALDDEERVEFLGEHVVEPEGFADLDGPEDLEDFGWNTIDDILFTIQLYSRDRRRDQLPRPVSDDEGKEDAEA